MVHPTLQSPPLRIAGRDAAVQPLLLELAGSTPKGQTGLTTAGRAGGQAVAGRRGYADNALDAIDTAGLSDDSKRELGALKKAYYDIRGQLSVSSQVGRRPPPPPPASAAAAADRPRPPRPQPAAPIDWKSYEAAVDKKTLGTFKKALEGE